MNPLEDEEDDEEHGEGKFEAIILVCCSFNFQPKALKAAGERVRVNMRLTDLSRQIHPRGTFQLKKLNNQKPRQN